jgi:hypothetical protein
MFEAMDGQLDRWGAARGRGAVRARKQRAGGRGGGVRARIARSRRWATEFVGCCMLLS